MARIIYGALATSINGSIGGTTFQSNAYGYTVKNKPNMVKPSTVLQNAQKNVFGAVVQAWVALTAAQRLDWDSWATTFPQYSKHNPTSQLSGFAIFCKVHNYRFIAYNIASRILVSPSFESFPVDTVVLHLKLVGGVLTLMTPFSIATGDVTCLFYASAPFAPSQNFVGTKTRFVDLQGDETVSTVWTVKYPAVFGKLPAVGDIIIVDLQMIGNTNGQVFARSSQRLTVAAS